MGINRFTITALLMVVVIQPICAFELATHAFLTNEAYKRSTLVNRSQSLIEMGVIQQSNHESLGNQYFDLSRSGVTLREAKEFSTDYMPTSVDEMSIESIYGWLIRGAIREDDHPSADNGQPMDDPVNATRPFNHFFDPHYNRPLDMGVIRNTGIDSLFGDRKRAVDWALGTLDNFAFSSPSLVDSSRKNHFSIVDARESMFRALTRKRIVDDGQGNLTLSNEITPAELALTDERLIKAYWATVFRTLGNVLHLVEDAAQPQHTRNDPHSGLWYIGAGHRSLFEGYIESRVSGNKGSLGFIASSPDYQHEIGFSYATYNPVSPLQPISYPVPLFNRYSDYFSTTPGPASNQGYGLSDFSNREFFSVGTNLNDNEYPSPSNDLSDYVQVYRSNQLGLQGTYLKGSVVDTIFSDESRLIEADNPENSGITLTKQSSWFQFLEDYNLTSFTSAYSLDQTVYDEIIPHLAGRAASYGAGLIDYFFRGSMEVLTPKEGVYAILDHSTKHIVANGVPYVAAEVNPNQPVYGFTKIKLNLRNTTADINVKGVIYPQNMGNGVLVAVARYHRNTCYDPYLHGDYVVTYQNQNTPIRPSGCGVDDTVADGYHLKEDRSVSRIVQVDSVSSVSAEEFIFDFSDDPIPVNAVNLVIQVVFRGELGTEEDAVAAAVKDISEPTYFNYDNPSDYFLMNGVYYKGDDIISSATLSQELQDTCFLDPTQEEVAAEDITGIRYHFNGYPLVSLDALSVKKYLRFALLADPDDPFSLYVEAAFNGVTFTSNNAIDGASHEITVGERTVNGEEEKYITNVNVDPLYIFRNVPFHKHSYVYKFCGTPDWAPPYEVMDELTNQDLDSGRVPALETLSETGRIWPQ